MVDWRVRFRKIFLNEESGQKMRTNKQKHSFKNLSRIKSGTKRNVLTFGWWMKSFRITSKSQLILVISTMKHVSYKCKAYGRSVQIWSFYLPVAVHSENEENDRQSSQQMPGTWGGALLPIGRENALVLTINQ